MNIKCFIKQYQIDLKRFYSKLMSNSRATVFQNTNSLIIIAYISLVTDTTS